MMDAPRSASARLASAAAIAQGTYYAATGVWSLVGIRSFQMVTGPKRDVWLVKTVGLLVLVIGAVLARAGVRAARDGRALPWEVPAIAGGSAVALGGIDAYYAGKGRISTVYLADALVELAFVAAWLVAWLGNLRAEGAETP